MSDNATVARGRWVRGGYYGGRRYNWPQCTYCGRAGTDCPAVECLLCGSRQCHGNGSGDGCCAVCYYGYLPGWSRSSEPKDCGYKSCDKDAIAKAPRVKRVCADHADRVKVLKMTLTEYVAEQVAVRDSGKGWQRWRFVEDVTR
jgi:hypothetical protein